MSFQIGSRAADPMASESDGSFGAAAAETAAGVDVRDKSLPSMRLRQFDGDRDGYEEWKKEVEAVELLYKVPEERLAPLIFLALAPGPGKPRDLLSHLDVKTDLCGWWAAEGVGDLRPIIHQAGFCKVG